MATERINNNLENNLANFLQDLSWTALKHGNRATLPAFQLALADSKELLICHEVVRVIPGKRLVAFGTWGNKQVVAKLFYEPRQAARHAQRDYAGVKALLESGVLTPTLYFNGVAKDRRVHVLLFERILGAQDVETLWQNRTSIKDILPLMYAMTIELATHHVLGILQHDMHCKNFLVKQKNIYTIDGGALQIFDKPIPKKESLENLGLFFSQLGVGTDELQKTLFQIYVQARGWIVKKNDIYNLSAAVTRWSNKRWEDYRKKILRSSSAFARRNTMNSVTVYDRAYEAPEFLALLKNPAAAFTHPEAQVLKAGRSATVIKIKLDERYFVLKRYNIKDAMHGLRRCLRATRAMTGWSLAQRLHLLGIATARPVAFVEKRVLGLRGKSYLIMEFVEGQHAGEFFTAQNAHDPNTVFVAQQMLAVFENLARLRITHGDLKMTNILITPQNKPVLIDLDGMHEHRSLLRFKLSFQQEMARFMVNWRDTPTVYAMFELLVQEVCRRLGIRV